MRMTKTDMRLHVKCLSVVLLFALAVTSCLMGVCGVFMHAKADDLTEVNLVGLGGGVQDNQSRFFVRLVLDTGFTETASPGNRKVLINGEEQSVQFYNTTDENDPSKRQMCMLVPYTLAPKADKTEITILKGSMFYGCVFAKEQTIILDNGTISLAPDPIAVTGVGGAAQDNNSRYFVRLITDPVFNDLDNAGKEYGSYTVEVDGEEKSVVFYNGQAEGGSADDRQLCMLLPYTIAPKSEKHEVTVKAGTKPGNYTIAEDVTIVAMYGKLYLKGEEPQEVDLAVTGVRGATQDASNRYFIRLITDPVFNDLGNAGKEYGSYTVEVDGEEKSVVFYNGQNDADGSTANDRQLCILLPYEIASKSTRHEITVLAGTNIWGYVIAEDFTFVTNGTVVSEKKELEPIRLSFRRNEIDDIDAASQSAQKRYVIYIKTDKTELGDTMYNNNEVVVDKGDPDNEKRASVNYLGGCAAPSWSSYEEAYDGTSIMMILPYDSVVAGATSPSEIDLHKITIEAGTILGEQYRVVDDFEFYVYGSYIAEDYKTIPNVKEGFFKVTKGIDNATVNYTAKNLEDVIAEANIVKLKANAKKDADNNVYMKSEDASIDFCKALRIGINEAEPQIKFRSTYTGGDVYIALEIRSMLDGGNNWLTDGAPTVRVRYIAETQGLCFDFFHNGLQGSPQFCIFDDGEFAFEQDEDYYIEFGAVNQEDRKGRDGFVFFVKIQQNDNIAYGECLMSGDYNISDSGTVTVYLSPANSAKNTAGTWYQPKNDVADFTIKAVDPDMGLMDNYNPTIRYAQGYAEYDISDIVPIGNGKTYTRNDADLENPAQSMINAKSVSVKSGGYSVKMVVRFTSDDFGATFAFRGRNAFAQTGYKIELAENIIQIGAVSVPSVFESGVSYNIEIGCIDYFIADETISSGCYVYLKVNGELIVSDHIDKMFGLGTYFCGLVEGGNGATVTVSSAKPVSEHTAVEIVTGANKSVIANGKKATLSYESNMATAFDTVTYEVVSGAARIEEDGIYSETDGKIVVRVKIENEYGVFYGSEVVFNDDSGASMSKKKKCGSCSSDIVSGGSIMSFVCCGMVLAILLTIGRRRKA